MQDAIRILILGVGNPGRGDDGLGPRLLERLRETEGGGPRVSAGESPPAARPPGNAGNAPAVDAEFRYQLNVEDALAIKGYDLVVFVDARETGDAPVEWEEIVPSKSISFSTHEMAPASVLALCEELFDKTPRAYVLSIRGYEWDMGEKLSEGAEKNLARAVETLRDFLGSTHGKKRSHRPQGSSGDE